MEGEKRRGRGNTRKKERGGTREVEKRKALCSHQTSLASSLSSSFFAESAKRAAREEKSE
jgi:hypothetical protein